jgi:hypothetical protein
MGKEAGMVQMGFDTDGTEMRLRTEPTGFERVVSLRPSIESLPVITEVGNGQNVLVIDASDPNFPTTVFRRDTWKPTDTTTLSALDTKKHFPVVIVYLPVSSESDLRAREVMLRTAAYRLNHHQSAIIVVEKNDQVKPDIETRASLLYQCRQPALVKISLIHGKKAPEGYVFWTARTRPKTKPIDLTKSEKGRRALESASAQSRRSLKEAGYHITNPSQVRERAQSTRHIPATLSGIKLATDVEVASDYPMVGTARVDRHGDWHAKEDLTDHDQETPEMPTPESPQTIVPEPAKGFSTQEGQHFDLADEGSSPEHPLTVRPGTEVDLYPPADIDPNNPVYFKGNQKYVLRWVSGPLGPGLYGVEIKPK